MLQQEQELELVRQELELELLELVQPERVKQGLGLQLLERVQQGLGLQLLELEPMQRQIQDKDYHIPLDNWRHNPRQLHTIHTENKLLH